MNEIVKVSYDTAHGHVELDLATVKNVLVKGDKSVTDGEGMLFLKLCESHKLDPFIGEAHLIKFGSAAQMVIGYDTYKRRADENPNHLYTESGIVVVRGQGEVVQKHGACLYPTETMIGGWCRVHRLRGDREVTTFKEVGFNEYNKGNAIWKEKPCTMIEKVAISQCLREAYPKDYVGLYTEEEIGMSSNDAPTSPAETVVVGKDGETVCTIENPNEPITQNDRKKMFLRAHLLFGDEDGNAMIKSLLEREGLSSTAGMTRGVFGRVMAEIDRIAAATEHGAAEPNE